MSIRTLVASDVAPLSAGLARLPLLIRYGRDAQRLAADLKAALSRGDGLLVEEEAGSPRGLAWFLASGTFGLGGYLRLIAVVPEATASGVGSALLAAFEAEVARFSRHAFLLVSDFNHGARRFYERHGYAGIGSIPGLVLPDVAELVYWKRLG
jgi:GNAT superfamily N-acetyltransferase